MLTTLSLNGTPDNQPRLGHETHILHQRGVRHRWHGVGPLSIKCFFGGRAFYDVGVGRYAVDDNCYLILNEGQSYSIDINCENEIESFCIFFERGFAEGVQRSLNETTSHLLDEPFLKGDPANFFEKTFAHDGILSP